MDETIRKILVSVMTAAIIALGAWVWSVNSRVQALEVLGPTVSEKIDDIKDRVDKIYELLLTQRKNQE